MHKINKRNFLITKFILFSSWLFPGKGFTYKKLNFGKLIKSNRFDNNTSFMAVDLRNNRIIDRYNENLKLPIASVTKMIMAQYAINSLGLDFRFKTDFFVDGVIRNGTLRGDIYIKGYGDPTLKTDDLDMIANYFKENGINEVTGSLFYDDTHLPNLKFINESQLPQYAYNPGFGAINLNENRILFRWKRKEKSNYLLDLSAKGIKSSGRVANIQIDTDNNRGNVYKYKFNEEDYSETWSVNKRILGRQGSRWLPVRNGAYYSVQVFEDLLSQKGINIKKIGKKKVPSNIKLFKSHLSKKLSYILLGTLKHSKNMISESIGFKVSRSRMGDLYDLDQSGVLMTKWFRSYVDSQSSLFLNHSGLTSSSFSNAADFRKFLLKREVRNRLLPLLKLIPIYTSKGKKRSLGNITVRGKSGTMHYIRGMSGYVCLDEKPVIGFAIFSADLLARRTNFSDKFEKPKGASAWLSRAVIQERKIIRGLCEHVQPNQ